MRKATLYERGLTSEPVAKGKDEEAELNRDQKRLCEVKTVGKQGRWHPQEDTS